ncbi:MAG: GGDEF domain-containing protein [Woeseiaceae bacterium]|nr:GGDEF domain-containing protein [Woeseiaceae bacterium]
MSTYARNPRPDAGSPWRPDLVWSVALMVAATAAVALAVAQVGFLDRGHGPGTAAFFLAFGLFTIAVGFPHPVFGHVSFDRVAQVMSILVLGPVDAAWVNGLASLLFPWHRLWRGVPLRLVITAAFHNAGLMTFVVLGAGLLYEQLGGAIPPVSLDVRSGVLLLVLIGAMQLINDGGMMFILYLRGESPWLVFNRFTAVVEYVSGAAGIVLAIAFSRDMPAFFVLVLVVLSAGMLVIMQYALMRYRLEKIVDERTEELRVQSQEFERQATHDALTALPNRRHADSYLQQQVELAQRNARGGAVALADIDWFKQINDTYSHAAGDSVLERVAQILAEGCRRTDFVARYGGEEFLLHFPDTDIERALRVCDQLRLAVQEADWSDVAPDFRVTISFGLAEIREGSRFTTILSEADMHLYRAKREGRNRVIAE